MEKRTIEITGQLDVLYDENSPEFKEALEGFIDMMDSDATADTMLIHIAANLKQWGDREDMIEGVGYVGLIGRPLPTKDYCGVQVSDDYGMLEYE